MISIVLNGEPRLVPPEQTVGELLITLGTPAGRVACEVNGSVVRRADHGKTILRDGDVVEVVQMIGGG